jgi:hypothetical protein
MFEIVTDINVRQTQTERRVEAIEEAVQRLKASF